MKSDPDSGFDRGYIYAPYIPVLMDYGRTIDDPWWKRLWITFLILLRIRKRFHPPLSRKGRMTRYAKKAIDGRMYKKVRIK